MKPVREEPPVDKSEGEPVEEDRIVPCTDDAETVGVDGVAMSKDCALKVLRGGALILCLQCHLDRLRGSCQWMFQLKFIVRDILMKGHRQKFQVAPSLLTPRFSSMHGSYVLVDDAPIGEQVPEIPRLDDEAKKKPLNQVTSTDLSLCGPEDEAVSFSFKEAELEELEEYETDFEYGEFYDDGEWIDDDDAF
eukprot:s111_g1.t1